jgi:hypothetical protein
MSPIRVAGLLAMPLLFMCSQTLACDLPALPPIPAAVAVDGVAKVIRDVRRYSDAMVEYTACLRTELEAAGGESAPPSVRAILIARNNLAIDEHNIVTALYTQRVGPLPNLRLAEYLDGESRDCLLVDSVVGIGVVSDSAVVFLMRGSQAYLNLLPATCPELARYGDFVLAGSATDVLSPGARGLIGPSQPGGLASVGAPLSRRVCDQDDIYPYREGGLARRVLECPLGRFYALPADEARQLIGAQRPLAQGVEPAAE